LPFILAIRQNFIFVQSGFTNYYYPVSLARQALRKTGINNRITKNSRIWKRFSFFYPELPVKSINNYYD